MSTTWSELHCHSAFSFMDGASQPEELAARAAELGYAALALTDHDNLAGMVAHAKACARVGIKPIAGVEATLADGSHLTLLARDAQGYRSLAGLVSHAHLAGSKGAPRLALDDLARYAVGLECLTGCRQGLVPRAILDGDERAAHVALDRLCDIFGRGHVWVEAQRCGLPDDDRLSYGLATLARRRGLPLAATGNSHYAASADRDLQDVLVCIRHRVPITQARPFLRPGGSWSLPAPAEMARRFAGYPLALRGAVELAGRCGFDLAHVDAAFPAFPVPTGQTASSYLRSLALIGARERYGTPLPDAVVARLEHELAVIAGLAMDDYILVVWDLVRYAREQGILCQGRGSSVGSAVCYCLGITAVEPLAHNLLFERFLSPGRTDPPDIDVDLPADRSAHGVARESVIQYALRRWNGHAALVANTVTYRSRSAVREVGMALGLTREQLDLLARESGDLLDTDSGAEDAPAAALRRLALPNGPVLRRLRELCARIEGLPRHLSQHPGGIVVTARPLAQVAPVEHARMPNRIVVQWDKDATEDAALVKIDLLGLGMLAAIDRCFELIEEETGTRPALHGFTCDDPRVYDALCRADTVGVFQVESRAQISLCLPQLQPRCYDDLTIAVALIRPGPIQGNAVHPLLRRRQGLEAVTYPGGEAGRRLLEPVLAETYGVCLYQDQVIALGIAAGLTPGEAAELRRAMSSARHPERMDVVCRPLQARLAACGLDEAAQEQVLAMLRTFASYGFLKGHAASFAYLSYVSTWLKVYHPAAFLAALLDMQPMGFYDKDTLVQDARRHGVRVLPVDLRHSRASCTLEEGAVRLGLRLVRGLGEEAAGRVEAAVAAAPFPRDLEELCVRARLDDDEARALARSGALRPFIARRREALWQAPLAATAAREGRLPGLTALVDPPARLPAPTALDDYRLDYAALGLAMGGHVLAHLRPGLPTALARTTDLLEMRSGSIVQIAGRVISRQRPPTAKGTVFLGLSDEVGLVNVVVPPSIYARDRVAARDEVLVWIEGVVERRERALTLRALAIYALDAMVSSSSGPCDAGPAESGRP